MKYLLDTCVLSELTKPLPNERAIHWIDSLPPSSLFISAVTVAEIMHGVERLPTSRRKESLRRWVDVDLRARFDGRILPFDKEAAECWGKLCARSEAQGKTPAYADSQIAAIAMSVGAVVVTRNVDDFDFCGLEVINPFD